METWKEIEGFETYKISSTGTVISKKGERKPYKNNSGYLYVGLSKGRGFTKREAIHRIVAQAFIPNPDNKKCVNHKDGNKENNNVENLEWCTPSENSLHSYKFLGRKYKSPMTGKFGSEHNRSLEICIRLADGKEEKFGSMAEFKRKTGLDHTSICWAGKHKALPYTFGKGRKMEGITLISVNKKDSA